MNKNILPLSQIGNTFNPKLVILLANPAGDTNCYEQFPEYKMGTKYKAELMGFDVFRQYCDWWDKILEKTDKYNINDTDICSLDFYPYHTKTSNDIPKKQYWDKYSLIQLEKNKELLFNFIKRKTPIFAYYWGHWLKEIPELTKYDKFYQSKNGWRSTKISEFDKFLKIYFDK